MDQIYVLLNAVLCNMRRLLLAAENNKEKERNETGLLIFVYWMRGEIKRSPLYLNTVFQTKELVHFSSEFV